MTAATGSAEMSIADTEQQEIFHKSSRSSNASFEVPTSTEVNSTAALNAVPDTASLEAEMPIEVGIDAAHRRSSISEENRIPTWIPIHVPGCQHKWHQEHPPHKPLHRFPHHAIHHEHPHAAGGAGHGHDHNQSRTENPSSTTDSAPGVDETCVCSVMKWWPDPKSYDTF